MSYLDWRLLYLENFRVIHLLGQLSRKFPGNVRFRAVIQKISVYFQNPLRLF